MALPGTIDLNLLLVFRAMVEAGSFTVAAQRLGVATAKVSLDIGRLEARLGVTLFARTTRKVVVSDAGQSLYNECRPLLDGLAQAVGHVNHVAKDEQELHGTLRIGCTVDHVTTSLAPALAKFAALHPRLALELRTSDRVVDIVAEGIDLAIRFGWLPDSSLRATKLGEFEQYVVASPALLKGKPQPEVPMDLSKFDWLTLTLLPSPLTWTFSNAAHETQTLRLKSRIRVDTTGALRALVEQQAGISIMDEYNARLGIASGRLVRLLPAWSLPRGGTYATYPPGKLMPTSVRAFTDFYRAYLEDLVITDIPERETLQRCSPAMRAES